MEPTKKRINEDVILITELDTNGLLINKDVEIQHPHSETLTKMEAMLKNPNRTLLDVQDIFESDDFSKNDHHICLLNEYNEAFVKPATYPKILSTFEYRTALADELSRLRIEYENNDLEIDSPVIKEDVARFIERLKYDFYQEAKRYIAAEDYIGTSQSITNLKDLKIISTESIGWSFFEHNVGKDIKFTIRTNFGYGRSAYFQTNMRFKGVDILPYSMVVKYPYASMQDMVRATRSYRAVRNNWELAMDFMASTANLATTNETEFLNTWIKNEVEEMMAGLRVIRNQPMKMVDKYRKSIDKETCYLSVRNFTQKEVETFLANKDEMLISLKATKMSNALMFLDNLKAISGMFNYIDYALQELKDLALSVIPEIEFLEGKVESQIRQNEDYLSKKTKELERKILEIKPFEDSLQAFISNNITPKESISSLRMRFIQANPQFKKLTEEKQELQSIVRELESFIYQRKKFLETIINQHETILSQSSKI